MKGENYLNNKKKNKRLLLLILSASALVGLASCENATPKVLAETLTGSKVKLASYGNGNHYISSLYIKEETTHKPYIDLTNKATTYTTSSYTKPGILIYAPINTGGTYASSEPLVSNNTFSIDFTNAVPDYPSKAAEEFVVELKYKFGIYNSGGSCVFYETMTGTDPTNSSTMTQTYYGYGVSTKNVTITDGTGGKAKVNLSYFGKRGLTLSDGDYTIKIEREYLWLESNSKGLVYWKTSSTATAPLTVDGTLPVITMKDTSGKTITNGGYANKNVNVTVSDSSKCWLYYKKPNSDATDYILYSYSNKTYTTDGGDGWYYFYAKDNLSNQTAEHSFYLDTVKPTGNIKSNGSYVSSGSYISNSFTYIALDSGSGISKIYYKSPVSGSYIEYSSGTIIPSTAGDGWYEFYAVDKAGNVSDHSKVYLETSVPEIAIYRNGKVVYEISMENGKTYNTDLYFNKGDKYRVDYDSSSGVASSSITLGKTYTLDGSSSTNSFTVTSATGIKSTFNYFVINEKPYITINGTKYESGATLYFNEDKDISFICDSVNKGDTNTGVTINGEFTSYSGISSKTLSASDGKAKTFEITLNDRAGNESTFKIIIDKDDPKGYFEDENGNYLESGSYTNKNVRFRISKSDTSLTYSYNNSEFTALSEDTVFANEGKYVVNVIDLAGNKSTFEIIIDKTAPKGRIYSDYKEVNDGAITNGKVYFTWDEDCTATINGSSYEKNSVLTEEGIYEFILTDKAGNKTSYKVEIDLTAPSKNKEDINSRKDYTVSKWYNVTFEDKKVSFASYDEALEYACGLEFDAYVTTLTLDDVSKFTQTHLIASGEVHEGTYYRYKSISNPNNELYYFDEEGLKEAIRSYAKTYVLDINYHDLDSDDLGEAGNDSMYSNTWNYEGSSVPVINGYTFTLTDSKEVYARLKGESEWTLVSTETPFDEQFKATGLYEIKEVDEAGNESIYEVFLDFSSPELKVNAEVFGEGESKEFIIDKDAVSTISAYYYKSFDIKKIIDNDPYATIAITNEGKTSHYSYGDELPFLSKGGKYDIKVYDRVGNNYSFTVYIVGNEADVTFTNNEDNTAFDIDITLEQDFDAIVSLEIYKDGEKLDWVSPELTHYTLTKDGTYKVVIKDNFGRTIVKEYDFDKALPEGTLSIEKNSKTTDDVSFSYDSSKYYAEVYKDGALIKTDTTGSITCDSDGKYEIKLINLTDEDNFNVYLFEIDRTSPDVVLEGVKNKGTTNGDVTVRWTDSDVVSSTYTLNGGEEVSFNNGEAFTKEGTYVIKVVDDMGNVNFKEFTIDKSLDYVVHDGNGNALTGTDITTSSDVTIENNENLNISISKDSHPYGYEFGETLTEEGKYSITITDEYGNATTFTIVIDKSVDFNSNISDGERTNGDVVINSNETATVIVTKDGKSYDYSLGETITEEGTYLVKIYDAYGNEETLTFTIDKSVDFDANVNDGESTNKDVTIKANEEVEITVKKDGEEYGYSLGDSFSEDGSYVVTIRDGLGNEETISFTIDKTAPEVNLNGIEDGGKDNVTVTIDGMTEEGEIKVYKDGEEVSYELGQELSEYGKYEVVVTDKLGNTRTYSFELAYKMNGATIALIGVGILLIGGVLTLIILKKKRVFKK